MDDRKDSPKYCFKVSTIPASKSERVYHRGCLVGDAKYYCDLERDKDAKVTCSLCSTTLCNSGSSKNIHQVLVFIGFLKVFVR